MSRDINLLEPKLIEIINKMKAENKTFCVTDTWRTKQEQDDLYAQGRTKPGKIVTNAKYPYSAHNWGIAFDFCRDDGKPAYDYSDGYFKKIGELGKKFGLEWGGDWKTFPDKPHLQLKLDVNELIKKYGTPDNYKKTWGETMIKTVDEAIAKLRDKGVMNSPEYWKNAVKVVKNLEQLLINMANKI